MHRWACLLLAFAGVVAQRVGGQQQAAASIATVTDVDADATGRIYIADERLGRVHILSAALRPIAEVGSRGNGGGGQYRALRAVRVISANRFAAIDRYLQRIDLYEWKDGRPTLARSIAVPFDPYDLCVRPDGRFWVLGLYNNHRIHLVDQKGVVSRSRAPRDTTIHINIASQVIDGGISCQADGEIALTSATSSEVVFLDMQGRMRVETLGPIRMLKMEVTRNGRGMRQWSPPEGFFTPSRAIPLGRMRYVGARQVARMDGVLGDSVRWYGYDTGAKKWTTYLESTGLLYPLRDRATALQVKVDAGFVELKLIPLAAVLKAE